MIEKDYLTLKSLADKFEGEFTEEASACNFQTLQHLAQERWLTKRPENGLWLWWITHEGKEALEEYEQELDAIKDRKAGNNIAKLALLISILSLLISATTIYLQYQ